MAHVVVVVGATSFRPPFVAVHGWGGWPRTAPSACSKRQRTAFRHQVPGTQWALGFRPHPTNWGDDHPDPKHKLDKDCRPRMLHRRFPSGWPTIPTQSMPQSRGSLWASQAHHGRRGLALPSQTWAQRPCPAGLGSSLGDVNGQPRWGGRHPSHSSHALEATETKPNKRSVQRLLGEMRAPQLRPGILSRRR